MSRPVKIFIVTGEHSGDALGGKLMTALRETLEAPIAFEGLGGDQMTEAGLQSLFPLDEVIVMGPIAIAKAYPRLRKRALECVDAAIAAEPDLLVIIDAPEFTHPIATRVRRARPNIPIVNYVSPSVWAWRPGRARKMRRYVDHLLALLPFEPPVHERLGGPTCTYVGHPLSERIDGVRAIDPGPLAERLSLAPETKKLVVLPGSRGSELDRLLSPFRETVTAVADAQIRETGERIEVLMPSVPRHLERLRQETATWPVPVHVLAGEDDKWRAFRLADAALAASGTVTLELGIAGTPMVVGYIIERFAAAFRFLLNVPSVVLANLVIEDNAFPEFLQEQCTPDLMAPAVLALLKDGPELAAQRAALDHLAQTMKPDDITPSMRAAAVVRDVLSAHRG